MSATGPHFIGIGQMKAATGWLFDQLSEHPDVWMPRQKELHFFDVGIKFRLAEATLADLMRADGQSASGILTHPCPPWQHEANRERVARDFEFFRRLLFTKEGRQARKRAPEVRRNVVPIRKRHVDWYRGLFPADGCVSGEITPAYGTLERSMIADIARWLPETKFILFLRTPVDRARSHLNHLVTSGRAEEGVLEDPAKAVELLTQYPVIIEKSDAAAIYNTWSEVVSERLLVQRFSTVKADPDSVRTEVAKFLGIRSDAACFPVASSFNRKETTRMSASPAVHELLADRLERQTSDFNAMLEAWP